MPVYYALTLGVFLVALAVPSVLGHTSARLVDLVKSLLFVPFRKGGSGVEPVLFVG